MKQIIPTSAAEGHPPAEQLTIIRRLIASDSAITERERHLRELLRVGIPNSLGELGIPDAPPDPSERLALTKPQERPTTCVTSQVKVNKAGYRTDLDAFAVIDLTKKLRAVPRWISGLDTPAQKLVAVFALVSSRLYSPRPFPLPSGLILLAVDGRDDPVVAEQIKAAFRVLIRRGILEIARQGGLTDRGRVPHLFFLHPPSA